LLHATLSYFYADWKNIFEAKRLSDLGYIVQFTYPSLSLASDLLDFAANDTIVLIINVLYKK